MTVKTQDIWPNPVQNISWFEFLSPGKAAALQSEERQNKEKLKYNYVHSILDAQTSESLTDKDNQKFIIVMGIIAVTIVLYSLT